MSEPLHQKAVKKREIPEPVEIEKQESGTVQMQLDTEQIGEKKSVTARSNGVQSFPTISSQEDEIRPEPAAMVPDPVVQWLQQVTKKMFRAPQWAGMEYSCTTGKGAACNEPVSTVACHCGPRGTTCRW
ncbi:MAG: hypothetical protein K9K37_00020 [Desulfocapsa sp.]|nr:hypothetical protein [Desulfocapsa sp.]